MSKPDGLSGCPGEEKSGLDLHLLDKGQGLDLENGDPGEEEDVETVELEGMDVATWEQKNGL